MSSLDASGWLLAGLAIEAFFVLVVLVRWALDRRAAHGFTSELLQQLDVRDTVAPRKSPSFRLAGALRDAGSTLERGLKSGKDVDESLAEASAAAGTAQLHPPLLWVLAADALLLLAALLPIVLTLAAASRDVAALWKTTRTEAWPAAYATSLEAIPAAFAGVRGGFAASALLLAGAFAVWALRWWLLRPEIREARVLRAFLRCATASGDVVAPLSLKTIGFLAPRRSLWPGLWSSIAFMLCSAAAVLVLTTTAARRRENNVPLTFRSWPELFVRADAFPKLAAPAYAAGTPLVRGPSLLIGSEGVQLGSARVVALRDGELAPDWQTGVSIGDALSSFRAGGEPVVLVLAHRGLPLATPIELFRWLKKAHRVSRLQLVLRREIPFSSGVARPVQSGLELELVDRASVAEGTPALVIAPSEVKLAGDGGTALPSGRAGWQAALREAVRARLAGNTVRDAPLRVAVETEGQLDYDRFVEVLAAVDSVCMLAVDCGLPGIGISYQLVLE